MSLRIYRTALAISVILNVLLVAVIWLYIHYEGLLTVVEEAVGFMN